MLAKAHLDGIRESGGLVEIPQRKATTVASAGSVAGTSDHVGATTLVKTLAAVTMLLPSVTRATSPDCRAEPHDAATHIAIRMIGPENVQGARMAGVAAGFVIALVVMARICCACRCCMARVCCACQCPGAAPLWRRAGAQRRGRVAHTPGPAG